MVALQLYIYEYPERALKDKKKKILPVRCFSVLYRHVWGELITKNKWYHDINHFKNAFLFIIYIVITIFVINSLDVVQTPNLSCNFYLFIGCLTITTRDASRCNILQALLSDINTKTGDITGTIFILQSGGSF